MRFTGFPPHVRDIIIARSDGMCEVMVKDICIYRAAHIHHRRARGMGGTRRISTNMPSNGLHVCALCHLWVEEHREEALDSGWLVRQNGDPVDVPVVWRGQLRWLDDSGGFEESRDVG